MLDFILGVIGTLLYPLFSIIFILLDVVQGLFFAFAGIGEVKVTGGSGFFAGTITGDNVDKMGQENGTGLIFYLLNTPLIKNLLISIMVLGLFLLVIFTTMAFIKNAYASKQKGWKEIVGNAIKGLANFIFIPVCCLLGIWLGNILLIAINGATSVGGATQMSRKLFIASAYNANIYRNSNGDIDEAKDNIEGFLEVYDMKGMFEVKPRSEFGSDAEAANYYADLIDKIYSVGDGFGSAGAGVPLYSHTSVGPGVTKGAGYYNLYQINYLTLIIGGVFMAYVLISLTYGMIRRMFILLMLYVISPALCAMYPLDDGKAVGSWKGDFIKQTISAYGAVAGLNIFFSLIPLIDNINFIAWSSNAGDSIIDSIIQLLILVSGLFVVKELIAMISGYIGADNAYTAGAGLRESTKKGIKDQTVNAAKKISGAFRIGNKINTGLGDPLGKLGGWLGESKLGKGVKAVGHGIKSGTNFVYDHTLGRLMHRKLNDEDYLEADKAYFEQAKSEGKFKGNLKNKSYDELSDKQKADIRKMREKYSGEPSDASTLASIGKSLWGGVKAAGSAYVENSEIAKSIADEIKYGYGSIIKDNEDFAKRQKDGKYGENKTAEEVNKVARKGFNEVVAKLDEISQKTAMSRIKAGEIAGISDGMLTRLGLTNKSSKDDFANADIVSRGLASFEKRINEAKTEEARKEIADQALSFIQSKDAGDNTALADLMNSSLEKFTSVKKDGKDINFGDSVEKFREDMTDVSEAIAKDFSDNMKKYVRKIWEDEAKKGGKK